MIYYKKFCSKRQEDGGLKNKCVFQFLVYDVRIFKPTVNQRWSRLIDHTFALTSVLFI